MWLRDGAKLFSQHEREAVGSGFVHSFDVGGEEPWGMSYSCVLSKVVVVVLAWNGLL